MFKNLLIAILGTAVAGLLSLNVAILTNAMVHDLLFRAVSHLRLARTWPKTPTAQRKQLKTQLAKLRTSHQVLKRQTLAVKAEKQALQTKANHRARKVRAISRRIARRLVRNTAMNVSSLPAEAIPWVGTALLVSVTAMDIKDACDTMADINAIARELELDEHQAEARTICGYRINVKEDRFDAIDGTIYQIIH
jgi:hypothetical protein